MLLFRFHEKMSKLDPVESVLSGNKRPRLSRSSVQEVLRRYQNTASYSDVNSSNQREKPAPAVNSKMVNCYQANWKAAKEVGFSADTTNPVSLGPIHRRPPPPLFQHISDDEESGVGLNRDNFEDDFVSAQDYDENVDTFMEVGSGGSEASLDDGEMPTPSKLEAIRQVDMVTTQGTSISLPATSGTASNEPYLAEGYRKIMSKSLKPLPEKPFIHPEVVTAWQSQMHTGLLLEYYRQVDEKFDPQHHYSQLLPPTLDTYIADAISPSLRARDAQMMKTQSFFSKAMVAIGEAMSLLAEDPQPAPDKIWDLMWDASSLLCAGSYRMSMARRRLVIAPLQKPIQKIALESSIGSCLFDNKTEDWLKRAQITKSASQLLGKRTYRQVFPQQREGAPSSSAKGSIYQPPPSTSPQHQGNGKRPAARQNGAAQRGRYKYPKQQGRSYHSTRK